MADVNKLKEVIRGLVKEIESEKEMDEMTGTGAVAGYATPFAFSGNKAAAKKKNKELAQSAGYDVVKDENIVKEDSEKGGVLNITPMSVKNIKTTATKAGGEKKKDTELADVSDMELAETGKNLAENRWLAIKNEDGSPKAKISKGVSHIKQQLGEVEKFVNWYSKLKTENGVKKEDYYKRTHKSLHKIKERLMNLSEKIRTL